VLDGYEFVGSVTAEKRFAGAMMVSSFELVTVAPNTPSRGGGVLQVMLPNVKFGLYLYWA